MEAGFSAFIIFGILGLFQAYNSDGSKFIDAYKSKNSPEIKAVYMTANTAGNKARREELLKFIKKSGINAVVIDVKDSTGRVFFDTQVELAKKIGSEKLNLAPDLREFVARLKKEKIYPIARLAVFQDPHLAEKLPDIALKSKKGGTWRDRKGLSWVDPSSPFVWKYNIDIARAAMLLGFYELNFDYIRFPTDGDLQDIVYPYFNEKIEEKTDVIAQFFYYVKKSFEKYPVYLSVDLFGITLWRSDGINIGQRYEDAAPYMDFISPMVYPSHYPDGFEGYGNPADFPYEIVYKSLEKSKNFLRGKKAKIRPWLQDFDLGAVYDAQKIQSQIRAAKDGGGVGWMLWNSSNRYTEEAHPFTP